MAEYIDREAVLWDLNHLWDWDSVDGITGSTVLKQVITDVKNVPAADVRENVKGKWIYNQTARHDAYWQCSICGNKWADSIYFNVGTTNFCPHCGADMRGGKDG